MSCTGNGERRELQITAYLDGELDLTSALELESHLEQCPDCARSLAAQRALQQAIAGADLHYRPAPDQVRRLRRKIAGGPAAPAWWADGPRLRAIAALLLVAVASWSLGRRWPARPERVPVAAAGRSGDTGTGGISGTAGTGLSGAAGTAGAALAEQVLASHVRAQLAGHPEDVASSDRHTVKPWFAGHLDYSPPVVDLAARGFPLRGGRLDYVGGRPVAVLTYQAGNHLVSIFVWPAEPAGAATAGSAGAESKPTAATAAAAAPEASSRRGFNQLRWTQAGMTWWAISDVSPDRLDDLVRRLRAELPPPPER